MTTVLDERLVAVLACPCQAHAPLTQQGEQLVCGSCGRHYPIQDGIPVLLMEEAIQA
ncbi:MAG: hypothetical protein HOQ05_03275 [Corynebacteriales bacterium]|nr:hypothetical protein [Mycobacteriales bacterium]